VIYDETVASCNSSQRRYEVGWKPRICKGGSVDANANLRNRNRHLSQFLKGLYFRFDCTAKIPSKQTFGHVLYDEIAQAEGKIAVRDEGGGHLAAPRLRAFNGGAQAVPASAFPQMQVMHLRVAVCCNVDEQFG